MRLSNMGVASFNIASSIHLITAQRLPRKLCIHCKVLIEYPDIALQDAGFKEDQIEDKSWKAYKAIGCNECNYTGYKGRIGIYQIMPISEDMQRIILAHGSVLDISTQAAKEGILSLRETGILKVMQGVTSLEEILAVTNSN
jgi:type IV pilus assembly protein PilB